MSAERKRESIALFGAQTPKNLKDSVNSRNGASKETLKKLDDEALDMMSAYSALHEQSGAAKAPQGYVTREAKISCSYGQGNYTIPLDAGKDYGAFSANGKPLLTCRDCLAGINIHSFGDCVAEIKSGKKIPRPLGVRVGKIGDKWIYRCMPEPVGQWRQKAGDLLLEDGESGEFNEVLTAEAYLTCRYGGIITINELAENEAKTETDDYLITLEQLDEYGFFMGADEEERQKGIEELNRVLIKYEINTSLRIAFFIGQVRKESWDGTRTLEKFAGDDPEAYFNKKYSNRGKGSLGNLGGDDGQLFRGAGYLQLTGRYNYGKFSEYIGDEKIMTEGYRLVGGVYNRDVSSIKASDKGVIDIGKYAWESAGWFWSICNPKGRNLNEYADQLDGKTITDTIHGNSESYLERNKYTNQLYNILTGESLGLPQ